MRSIELLTTHCRLRLPHPNDSSAIQRYRLTNRAFLQPWLPTYHLQRFNLDHIDRTTKIQLEWYLDGRLVPLLILGRRSNRLLGRITYSHLSRGNAQTCIVAYQLGEEYNGQGLITEALQASNAYLFEALGFRRIEALIMPRNAPSIRVAQKLGFRYEGVSRELLQINGIWEDHARYALLCAES